ncbi:M1 family aminopeptidase [Aureibaculum luteum]|uniref:M1 family aminopeptidase n=1 Tax=Aureibaculum luteum TaxID=1548456 RepID=UPI000E4EDF41|nr:M1 family aminopeptidase [Aureibaculum luteum]
MPLKQNILTLLFIFGGCFAFAQQMELSTIIEAEAKAATKLINYKANINTANYDVTHHRMDWVIDPAIAFINGDVTTTFTALENLSTVTFDLDDNMLVSAVSENETSLAFSQNANDELIITLPQTLLQGESTAIKITYSGNPQSSGFGSFEQTEHNGTPIIWTLSEPFGAKGWWPCKQDLNDKIDSIDVYLKTPELYTAVSNGLEQSQTLNAGQKTTHFKHKYPIPAYLIAIAVTNYSTYNHTVANNGNPFEIVNYVYPENLASAQSQTPVTVEIMNLFTELFEEYPFADEKYGHAQFGWGGGMEHTTVSFMGSFNRGLIAHELAHQWFGNKITCGSWKDIWLNESFATYLAGITIENLDGEPSFKSWRTSSVNQITSQPDGSVYLSDIDTTNVSRIFNGRLSYTKGSMVLHMLRKKLGDVVFFQGMKNYLADPNLAYSYAKTPDFIANMENASGEDLSDFFADWIYGEGHPSYSATWVQPENDEIKITINQTQSHASVSYFEASIPVRITGTNNEILDVVLNNTTDGQEFTETVSFQVAQIQIDPDVHLISTNNTAVLGIDNEISSQFNVFPNPVTNILTITTTGLTSIENITIYNTLGQMEREFTTSENIDVSTLTNGLHFIRIKTDKNTINKSFLKQ